MRQVANSSTLVAVVLTVVMASVHSNADAADSVYYRWLDDRGNPVHSDRAPPPGVEYEVVSTDSNLMREVEPEEGVVPLEVTPRVGNDFEAVSKKEVSFKKNPEYCERARHNLYMLEKVARIRVRDEQGEYRFIDEEEKEIERQKARDTVAAHCD